ncbi:DUF420 domain-containing protein [Bacillus haynesii]|uniref:DUF420 domain-containing protein n=1 Tax=Bacillus TaxID=1386 RepID=UPI0012B85E1E|nr:DUF420 domain-containing protein [Bacillus haynesii]TWK12472.1 hypothetical protein CHCC20375_3695 [Bacillus licheniformis]MCY7755777.1 DUF420 domain-containing protein [Bacillus haynesii]MCY7835837.1 DUF420 domain-containing protein [Bacillus haynesii]MCY7846911.1 DUF420 domain-containing protein [Bacillus haynesii]MCY7849992.1 DUF420 domain-containing protein [Bacillus haynesii]
MTHKQKNKNYTGIVVALTIMINGVIALLFFMPKSDKFAHLDLTFLPLLNAVCNSFTFIFLVAALIMIKQKNIKAHKRFIFAAFTTTFIFLVSYLTYHSLMPDTHFGGEGIIRPIYFFILITHIVLSALIVPLALFTLFRGLSMQVERHRKIARWTMPLWLYVSLTGVLVYMMISPYY